MTLIDRRGTGKKPYQVPYYVYDLRSYCWTACPVSCANAAGPELVEEAVRDALAELLGADLESLDVTLLGLASEQR